MKKLYAGIDAGGTAFKCIVGSGPDNIAVFEAIPVATPEETLASCADFFLHAQQQYGAFEGMGIACFGPIDLHRDSPHYGSITSTPKPLWSNTNIVAYFKKLLGISMTFDTDVNGALLGEQRWGAAQGLHSAVYVTVGTGIGAGVLMNDRLIYGAIHTEAGHMLLPHQRDDNFHGVCPYHGACAEGLASGKAMSERWQSAPEKLPEGHPAWELQAHYLASMCMNLSLCYSPERIILGGGIMQHAPLLGMVQQSYLAQVNGYLGDRADSIQDFIVAASLGEKAGALGALSMALSSAVLSRP